MKLLSPPNSEQSEPPFWFISEKREENPDLCDDEIMQEWIKHLERQR